MAADFRKFLDVLEQRGQLRRIKTLVDSDLEIAEIANRMLQCGGPKDTINFMLPDTKKKK